MKDERDEYTGLLDAIVGSLMEEASRLEAQYGLPPFTAQIKWEKDEQGWPNKARIYIPTGVVCECTNSDGHDELTCRILNEEEDE